MIGLGTGSTIKFFIDCLVAENLHRDKTIYVSSIDTLYYLHEKGLEAYTPRDLGEGVSIDVYVDGFDEASLNLDLVKGRGGAFYWEKLLATRSRLRTYIGEYTKYNMRTYLYLKPVPVEVEPGSLFQTFALLRVKGFNPRIRMGKARDGPVVTDSGNNIIDLYLDKVLDVYETDQLIKSFKGVLETGLFPNKLVDYLLISYPYNVVKLFKKR